MTKKIIAFGASNSTKSINKTLANYASKKLAKVEFELLDLNDFEMPIYSADREAESGIRNWHISLKNELRTLMGF